MSGRAFVDAPKPAGFHAAAGSGGNYRLRKRHRSCTTSFSKAGAICVDCVSRWAGTQKGNQRS